jgi:hypothetical protein
MYEGLPSFEKEPEHIPTLEEIQWVLEELIKGKNYNVVRCLKDSEGVYLFEATTRDKSTNQILEYSYMTKRRPGNLNRSSVTEMDIVSYENEDAYRESNVERADTVAKYIDGNWEILIDGNWEGL